MAQWTTWFGVLTLSWLMAAASTAGEPSRGADWTKGFPLPSDHSGREAYAQGAFRILYDRTGRHAVPARDVDADGVPDFVQDVAKQLAAAAHVFRDVYAYPDPLDSPRYPGAARIYVRVYDRRKLDGYKGRAFDKTSPVRLPGDGEGRALVIWLANDVDPTRNATPAHEYFHLVQNGVSSIKNAWYYEGMARWAEDALQRRSPSECGRDALRRMVNEPDARADLTAASYDAAQRVWGPLAACCGKEAGMSLKPDDPLHDLAYANGSRVLEDHHFPGAATGRDLLASLVRQEGGAGTEGRGNDRTEAEQRAAENDAVLLDALRRTLEVCL